MVVCGFVESSSREDSEHGEGPLAFPFTSEKKMRPWAYLFHRDHDLNLLDMIKGATTDQFALSLIGNHIRPLVSDGKSEVLPPAKRTFELWNTTTIGGNVPDTMKTLIRLDTDTEGLNTQHTVAIKLQYQFSR